MKGDIFHILNRGVEKRNIFLNDKNRLRFVHNLEDFNDARPVDVSYHRRRMSALGEPTHSSKRKKLVSNLCWCLMSNHFHDLVLEEVDGGTGMFSQKITSGYTQSFNLENNRSGVLFQSGTKIIPVVKDEHFLFLPFYILSNPIKLIESKWKVKNHKRVIRFLENYRWSSYLDIIGKENFPYTINKKLFLVVK